MDSDKRDDDTKGVNRRNFMAAGAAGMVAAATAFSPAAAKSMPPDRKKARTNSPSGKRVAIVTDAQLNMGPDVAREFARLGYGIVIADVRKGLEKELKDLGAYKVVVVPGIEQDGKNNEGRPGAIQKVVDATMAEFGGFDSVFMRTAWHGGNDIFEETPENMKLSYDQNCMAVFYGLQAVLPPLIKGGGGQIVVQTSATGEKPHPGLVSYSVMRAAANMMCQCAALNVADKNVTINAVGTNFMNYPGFKHTLGADKDPKVMEALLELIPAARLGEMREAAHFAMALLDGHNMYTTGSFFPISGGFNNAGM